MKNSKRTWLKGGLAIVSALLLCFLIVNLNSREPRYQGKRLSTWMDELADKTKNASESEALAAETRQLDILTNVVRAVGASGLPCYLDWIENQPRGNSWHEKLTDWVGQITHYRVRGPRRQDRANEAILAMQILGSSAKPAIIPLGRLLNVESSCGAAAVCLAAIGSDAVPVLTNALLTSTNARIRAAAARALGDMGTMATPAKVALLEIIQKEQPSTSLTISTSDLALRALVEMDSASDELLPVLAKELFATNAAAGAAYGLAQFGGPGIKFLNQALTNQNTKIRASAEAALDLQKYLEAKRQTPPHAFDHFNAVYNNRLLRVSIIPPLNRN